MSRNRSEKLSRREFAGTLAAGLAAPALLGALPAVAQEKKEPPPAPVAAAPEKSEEEKMLETLRAFAVPEGAEPAFVFRAAWSPRR